MTPLRTTITTTLQGRSFSTPLQLADAINYARNWQRVRDELKAMQAEGLVTGSLEGRAVEPIRLVAG